MDDRIERMQVPSAGTGWVSHLVIGFFLTSVVAVATPVARAQATPMYPWREEGHDAGHTWSNGGPSPSTDVPLWTSNTGKDLGGVGAVAHGLEFVQQTDGVVALNEKTGALVKTYSVAGPRDFAVSGNRLVVGDAAGSVRAFGRAGRR